MKTVAEIRNADDTLVRTLSVPDDWVPAEHKFGAEQPTRWVGVFSAPPPPFDPVLEMLAPNPPGLVDGVWVVNSQRVVPRPPPEQVALADFRIILSRRGLLERAKVVVAALPEPHRMEATEKLEYANHIRRSHPLLAALAAQLGLNPATVDDIFREAAALDGPDLP